MGKVDRTVYVLFPCLLLFLTLYVFNQNHNEWSNYKRPLKVLVEEIYEKHPGASLPSEVSGQPTIPSKNSKQLVPNPYIPGPFTSPGWPSHQVSGLSTYPPWSMSLLPHTPFYPQYPPTTHPDAVPNPPINKETSQSPDDDDQHFEFPSIVDFFDNLTITESSHHNFMDYVVSFHEQGYYDVDQLADKSLTAEHLVQIIPDLKDGTARVIKRKATERVRQVKKAKLEK